MWPPESVVGVVVLTCVSEESPVEPSDDVLVTVPLVPDPVVDSDVAPAEVEPSLVVEDDAAVPASDPVSPAVVPESPAPSQANTSASDTITTVCSIVPPTPGAAPRETPIQGAA
jgi:hypothetical protein